VLLTRAADFFSIGTNDLIQYTMACDRMNEAVSELYQPLNSSVLQLINMVIDAAHGQGMWVACAGRWPVILEPYNCFRYGLGRVQHESRQHSRAAKKQLRTLSMLDAVVLAGKALLCATQEEVEAPVAGSAAQ
jgi:phosphoenolpyruvate-protein phosphotransferase (PTS system enzyme I)